VSINVDGFCSLSLDERHSRVESHGFLDTGCHVRQLGQVIPGKTLQSNIMTVWTLTPHLQEWFICH
jgi:hypothetical protein